jgi:glycyl-tRNA synthetase
VVLRLPAVLAPLSWHDAAGAQGRPSRDLTKNINDLKFDFNCQYDEKDSIGKRYRRQDAIGTPYCITIDYQTAEDETVTIRYRDSMAQEGCR